MHLGPFLFSFYYGKAALMKLIFIQVKNGIQFRKPGQSSVRLILVKLQH